jgi:uncharacterized protein
MSDLRPTLTRGDQLDSALSALLASAPEIEAAAVVTVDGLAMASALPDSLDEGRVAAMSAALLSLGERAAAGLGRGELSQVFIEGETGTVFLVSAEDEAVLVAVASQGAKTGLMLFEVRRTASVVARVLRDEPAFEPAEPEFSPEVLTALSEQPAVLDSAEPSPEVLPPAESYDSFGSVAPPWEGTSIHVAAGPAPTFFASPEPASTLEPVPAPWAEGVDGSWAPLYAPADSAEPTEPEAAPAPWL